MSRQRSKVLVIQWARLGDLFHSRPLCVSALRELFPADVTLCCDARYESVVRDFPEVDYVIPVNLGKLTAEIRTDATLPDVLAGFIDLHREIGSFDVVINLTNCEAAAQFARSIHARQMYGYGFDDKGVLREFASRERSGQQHKHISEVWSALISDDARALPLMAIGTDVIKKHSTSIALICDAGSAERSLTVETIDHILSHLSDLGAQRIVLLGSTSAPAVKHSSIVTDLRGMTTLADLKVLLSEAEAVIGPDTGALHYAAALGKPVLGIFLDGASPEATGPLTKKSRTVVAQRQDDAFQNELASALTSFIDNSPSDMELSPDIQETRCQLSIVISEYGQTHYADKLLQCLDACELPQNTELIVMSSGLDTFNMQVALSRTNVLADATESKRSFAKVCNRGALIARGEWLMFLNDDCELEPSAFSCLWQSRSSSEIVGPVLRNWDGTIQSAGYTFDGYEVNEAHSTDIATNSVIHGVSAAAMLVSRDVLYSLGGFDTGFRNGYEDVDFCLRAHARGIRTHIANCNVVHFKGSSPERFDCDCDNLERLKSRWSESRPPKRASQRSKTSATPLLIFSDERQESAGAMLRWVDPLNRCGLRLGKDFGWLNTVNANEETARDALRSASSVIVFRSVSSDVARKSILNWQAERNGPLCYDCDDLLIGRFPRDSQREVARRSFEVAVREIASHADILTAPNEHLFSQFGKVQARRIVINTLPLHLHLMTRATHRRVSEFRIGYAGSTVHQTDLAIVAPAIEQLLESDESFRFYWWGAHPAGLSNHPQVRRGGGWIDDYSAHVRRIQNANIDLWIAPLGDAPHNSMRSVIKAFEYIGCGAPCLFSDVDPFRRELQTVTPHLLVENTTGAWIDAIKHWRSADELSTYHSESTRAKAMITQLGQNRTAYRQLIRMLPLHSQKDSACAHGALIS